MATEREVSIQGLLRDADVARAALLLAKHGQPVPVAGQLPLVVGGFVGDRVIAPDLLAKLIDAATRKGDCLTAAEVLTVLEPERGDHRDR